MYCITTITLFRNLITATTETNSSKFDIKFVKTSQTIKPETAIKKWTLKYAASYADETSKKRNKRLYKYKRIFYLFAHFALVVHLNRSGNNFELKNEVLIKNEII